MEDLHKPSKPFLKDSCNTSASAIKVFCVHCSATFVFATFETDDVEMAGVPNAAYLFLIGLLMAQGMSQTLCMLLSPTETIMFN